jgi:hypothetical protein
VTDQAIRAYPVPPAFLEICVSKGVSEGVGEIIVDKGVRAVEREGKEVEGVTEVKENGDLAFMTCSRGRDRVVRRRPEKKMAALGKEPRGVAAQLYWPEITTITGCCQVK